MGHQVIECGNCGNLVMEGRNTWSCGICNYEYNPLRNVKWVYEKPEAKFVITDEMIEKAAGIFG